MPSSRSQPTITQPNASQPANSAMRRYQKHASASLAGQDAQAGIARREQRAAERRTTSRTAMKAARNAITAWRVRGGQSKARNAAALPSVNAATPPRSRARRQADRAQALGVASVAEVPIERLDNEAENDEADDQAEHMVRPRLPFLRELAGTRPNAAAVRRCGDQRREVLAQRVDAPVEVTAAVSSAICDAAALYGTATVLDRTPRSWHRSVAGECSARASAPGWSALSP